MMNATATMTLNDLIANRVWFFRFKITLKKSGKVSVFTQLGWDRDDARNRLLEGNLKGWNWDRWTLEDIG
jgi:hypothetical protein